MDKSGNCGNQVLGKTLHSVVWYKTAKFKMSVDKENKDLKKLPISILLI